MENLAFAWNEEEEGCLPIPPLDDGAFSPYSPTTSDLLDVWDFFNFFNFYAVTNQIWALFTD